jgi:hypothetical protein
VDGQVVQALFAQVPVLVEGASDRACFTVFWDKLAANKEVSARDARALDFINCEGAPLQPEMARLLCEAGKPVVAWAELDTPKELERLRAQGHCAALVLYPDDPDRHNLEAALSVMCSLQALATGMQLIAETRGYSWEEQRGDLLSRCPEGVTPEQREAMKVASDVAELVSALPEVAARRLVRAALDPKGVGPFEMKGARPARLLAEKIVAAEGVPEPFARAMKGLDTWIGVNCPDGPNELRME